MTLRQQNAALRGRDVLSDSRFIFHELVCHVSSPQALTAAVQRSSLAGRPVMGQRVNLSACQPSRANGSYSDARKQSST